LDRKKLLVGAPQDLRKDKTLRSATFGYSIKVNGNAVGTLLHPVTDTPLICVEAFERHVDTCKSGIPTPMVTADVVMIPPPPDSASKGRDRTCVDNENGSDVPGECIASQAAVAVQTDIPICFENEQEKMILPSGSGLNLQPIYSSYGGAGSQITTSEVSIQAKKCNVNVFALAVGFISIKDLVQEGIRGFDEYIGAADTSISIIDSVLNCDDGAQYEKRLAPIESAIRIMQDKFSAQNAARNTKHTLRDAALELIPLSEKSLIDLKILSSQIGERFNDLSETVILSAELMGAIAQIRANIDLLVIARDPNAKTKSETCTKLVNNYYDHINDAIDNLDRAKTKFDNNFNDFVECKYECGICIDCEKKNGRCTSFELSFNSKRDNHARCYSRQLDGNDILKPKINHEEVWCEREVCTVTKTKSCCFGSGIGSSCFPCSGCKTWGCSPSSLDARLSSVTLRAKDDWAKMKDKWWNGEGNEGDEDYIEGVSSFYEKLDDLKDQPRLKVEALCGAKVSSVE
jgi:hypothetical protein